MLTGSAARGSVCDFEGDIYVADTGNARVVVLDSEGQFVRAIGQPVSDVEGVIPEGFRYRPIRLAVDSARRLFVVAEGQFEGIVEFDENGVFRGFFGAPRVAPRLIDVLWTKIASRESAGSWLLKRPNTAALTLTARALQPAGEKADRADRASSPGGRPAGAGFTEGRQGSDIKRS